MNATKPTVVAQLPVPSMTSGGKLQPIVPTTWQDAVAMAGAFVRAGMVPKHFQDSTEKVTVAIVTGLEVGLTPMAALQSIAVINNMPTIFGDGLVALVRASGYLEDLQEGLQVDDKGLPEIAWCKVKRKGEASWKERTLTRPECQRAGWWGKAGPWSLTPGRMMTVRCRGWLLRDVFADVLRGLHSAEEVQDMVDVTAQGSADIPAEPRRQDFVEPSKKPDQPAAEVPVASSKDASGSGHTVGSAPAAVDGAANPADQPAPASKMTDVEAVITFPDFNTAKEFLDFTSGWISEPERTPAEARQWEERFRTKIAEYGQHQFPNTKTGKSWIKDSMTDILAVYAQILAKEQEAK